MSRDRDPYERTLDVLRRQLRAGRFGEGQPLQIQHLASDLGVSTTPVREALSRLSGEGLIERATSGYVSHRYDAVSLGDLYRLDGVYALAAIAPSWPAPRPRPGPRQVNSLWTADDYVGSTEALLQRLGDARDRVLGAARRNLCDRLAPFRAAEVGVFEDLEAEAWTLDAALSSGVSVKVQTLVRSYYRRRARYSAEILHLFRISKYQSNIP